MAKYSEETTREHREMVREQLIRSPFVTIQAIQRSLAEKNSLGIKLDKDYINRLIGEVREERITRAERFNKQLLHVSFSDENDLIRKKLWEVVGSPLSTASERINALREIRNTSAMFLDRIASANLYTSQDELTNRFADMGEEEFRQEEERITNNIRERLARIDELRGRTPNTEMTRNGGMESLSSSDDV